MHRTPTRVLHVVNSLKGSGGGERMLYDLVTHRDRARYDAQVLCLYRAGDLAPALEAEGVPVQVLELDPLIRPRNWIGVHRAVRARRPAIVHAHLAAGCWFGLPAARSAGVGVRIGHIQNTHPNWGPRLRGLDRLTARSGTAFIACSKAVRSYCVSELRYHEDRIRVVANAVDFERFDQIPSRSQARAQLDLPASAPLLITVGKMTRQKGHDDLLRAFALVRRSFADAVLLVVGEGPEQRELEAIAASELPEGSVRFLGTRADVPELLAACDVFALASRWEGFGIVFAEAAAAGVPVVGTAVGGIPEVVESGVTGYVVPPGDVDALADALGSMLRDPAGRARMGRDAAAMVRERFGIGAAVAAVEELYESQLREAN